MPAGSERPGLPRTWRPLGVRVAGVFFGVLLVGFAYLWRFGYLDWVRSAATTSLKVQYRTGIDLSKEARIDRAI